MAENRSRDTEENTNVSGLISHIEFLTDDPRRSASFYQNVFGWEISNYQLEGKDYTGWRNPSGGVPGGFRKRLEGERSCIVNYVKTFDLDETLQKITSRGGVVTCQKRLIPEVGWICRFKDPLGNMMGLFQPNITTKE